MAKKQSVESKVKDIKRRTKKRLSGDTQRQANSSEVLKLKEENFDLKQLVAELSLENRMVKKVSMVPSKC